MSVRENIYRVTKNFLRTTSSIYSGEAMVYRPNIIREKEKLVELTKNKLHDVLNSEIARKIRVAKGYYALEMAPPKMNEIQRLKSDISLAKEFMQTGCWKFLTVRQAWLLLLVVTEVGLWFFLGETIGKMHIVGYKV